MKKNSNLGEHITTLRGTLGESQVKFARRFNVKPPTVSRWEAGKVKTLPARVLVKLSSLATGEESLFFWDQAGIGLPRTEASPKVLLVRPKKGEMVQVPPFRESVQESKERRAALSLPRELLPSLHQTSYFTVSDKTWGDPFLPGDILLLDESSNNAKSLFPFWDRLVLIDSTGERGGSKISGAHWNQLIGRLVFTKTPVGPVELAWSAQLHPWTTIKAVEPFTVGFWWHEFSRSTKLGPEDYPSKKVVEKNAKTAEGRARDELRLHEGYRILGRVTAWIRPPHKAD